jgi:hypothetical protein
MYKIAAKFTSGGPHEKHVLQLGILRTISAFAFRHREICHSSQNDKFFGKTLYRKSKDTFYAQQLLRKSCRFTKHVTEPDQQKTTSCWAENMRFACWMTKARTHTHTQYLTVFAFPWQKWLRECFYVTLYVYCVCCFDQAKHFNREQNVSPDTVNTTPFYNYHTQNHNQNTPVHTSTNCDLAEEWSTNSYKPETYLECTNKHCKLFTSLVGFVR